MNRQQRRKREREDQKKITVGQAKTMQKNTAKGIIYETLETYNAALALTLRDKHGFGEKRLQKFFSDMGTVIEDTVNGHLEVEDIQKTILDETGYNLRS